MLLTDVSGCSPVVKEGQVQQVGTVRVSDKAFCSLRLINCDACAILIQLVQLMRLRKVKPNAAQLS